MANHGLPRSALPGSDPKTGAGVVGSAVVAEEFGNEAVHKTVLHLTNVPVSVASITTGAGVGGATVYTFPEGYIQLHGAVAELDVSIATANQADFTDGTPEGDIGVGTLAPANADALGTDATDDNICTAAAILMSAFAQSSINLAPEPSSNFDGSATAVNVVVNILIDAVDIDDGVTSEVLVSGTITVVWSKLGDVT